MRLETKRLILREWEKGDVEDLVEGLNNLSVAKWLAFVPHPYIEKDAKMWIRSCVKNAKAGTDRQSYEFAIELKSEGKVIGGVSLNKISTFHGTAGGGIWLNARYKAKGYGHEAFEEKIRFAFEKLKLRRLENGFFNRNRASLNMQKGFG